ncbi:MAG: T9SS type A sorting domain-containing protein [Bacteroidales bacterium]|nr:T9SS type A sorting domain-containing protein [Bacteroidales bacterium]NPV35207.1 T9SS type A sorting domain-containing protein [Bacteroidales bacterium]
MFFPLRGLLMCICLLPVAFEATGQIPSGFHPRFCLFDMEESHVGGTETHWTGKIGGTGSFVTQHDYSYVKDAEGNLQALCVTRQVEGSELKLIDNKKPKNPGNEKIRITPNPAKDEVTIMGAWSSSVYFFDCFGRQVLFKRLGTDLKLDITGLPCGIYTVKIERQGIIYTLPLLIQP